MSTAMSFRWRVVLGSSVFASLGGVPGRGLLAQEPPHGITYEARVIEASTGAPLEGVGVQAREHATLWRCAEWSPPHNCQNCFTEDWLRWSTDYTEADGTVAIEFTQRYCQQVSSDPPEWNTSVHAYFEEPELTLSSSDPVEEWLVQSVVEGPAPFDHTIRLAREREIAEMYAPVLHKHRYDQQQDLGNCETTLRDVATLACYNVIGQALYHRHDVPPLHVWDDHGDWDSFGWASGYAQYWQLDLSDDFRHRGAEQGARPVYYHIYRSGEELYVQYWWWMNANDVPVQPDHPDEFAFWHEGDWEHIALRLAPEGTGWRPLQVAFYQHEGSETVDAADCWWGPSRTASYVDVVAGWNPSRTHPHVWVAANTHASYNRYSPRYLIHVDGIMECNSDFFDQVDYNLTDEDDGAHRFFEYDLLVPLGEVWAVEDAHGEEWVSHLEGNGPEFLRFVGRFGDNSTIWSETCDNVLENPFWSVYSLAPRSPAIAEGHHDWLDFPTQLGRSGNSSGMFHTVSWITGRLRGNYLGEFKSCGGAPGDSIVMRIPMGEAGWAHVVVLSGDPSLSGLNGENRQLIIPGDDGVGTFRSRVLGGNGEVRIDVSEYASWEPRYAEDFRLDVRTIDCGIANAPEPGAGAPRPLVVVPNVGSGPFRLQFGATVPAGTRVEILDAGGRRVFAADLTAPAADLLVQPSEIEDLPSGTYFVVAAHPAGPRQDGRLLLVR